MTEPHQTLEDSSRRALLRFGASAVLISAIPVTALAASDQIDQAKLELFGDRPVTPGRVTLKLPAIAENGYSVPIDIAVDSPMTEDDHVKRIVILSPRNPYPLIGSFNLGPRAGLANISTRIRLGGSQTLHVIAEMNDGRLFSGTADTVVTLAACVVL